MRKKILVNVVLVTTTLIGATAAYSGTYGKEWTYFSGYSTSGAPTGMTNLNSQFPIDLVSNVLTVLPEGRTVTPSLITNDRGANLFLKKDAHIKVAYVAEGAGYRNGLGFFQFMPDDLDNGSFAPSTKIIFPDFSSDKLNSGDTVDLGTYSAGSAIGFTMVSNGWMSGDSKVNPSQDTNHIFYTIKGINPEADTTYRPHTVLLSSPQDEMLILGIEDLNRTPGTSLNDYGYVSDEDFNDAIIAIFVEPFDAVDRGEINTLCTGSCEESPGSTAPTTGFSGRLNWREKTDQKTGQETNQQIGQ